MSKVESTVEKFRRLLKIRTAFKLVSQISWNVTTLERRFPVDVATNEEIDGLLKSYEDSIVWLEDAMKQIKKSLSE